MKRFLFVAVPEKGHLNPMIGPAARLRDRGHSVAFFCGRDVSPQLRRAGLEAVPEMAALPPPAAENRGDEFARRVRDREWLRGWIKALLLEAVDGQVEPMLRAIRGFRPDAVVLDPMIYAAVIAAHREGLPWAALSNSLNPVLDGSVRSELLDTVAWLAPERAAQFARHRMSVRFSGCDAISPHLTIAFTTEELIGRRVEGVHLVGPSLPRGPRGDESSFPWDRLRGDRRLVYLSFGSQVFHQPELFRLVMEATAPLSVQLVIAAQGLEGSPELGSLPDHVLACGYAPQLALLPRTAAFITHGGANSVMEALHFGVPLLISPVCNDQFHQAHFVERAHAGKVLDLSRSTVLECRRTLELLLHDESIHRALARVSASYRRDGAEEAARLIEEHL